MWRFCKTLHTKQENSSVTLINVLLKLVQFGKNVDREKEKLCLGTESG